MRERATINEFQSMDKDIFMFGDSGNSVASMLPALMQNRGMDPNLVAALMNGNNNRGAWGGDGCWWMWIILLFFCWGGNGFGFGGNGMNSLPAQLNGDAGREMLMNALQGNGNDIRQLSTSLNCSISQIQNALCGLQGSIDKVAGQVGMTGQQVINSIQSVGCQIGNQLAQCCCELRESITKMGYENQLATVNQTNTLTNNANTQFNILGAKIDAQTQIINDKFCQLEMREMQRENQNLRDQVQAYQLSASQQAQTANIISQLKPCPVPAYLTCNPNAPYYGGPGYGYPGGFDNGCGC